MDGLSSPLQALWGKPCLQIDTISYLKQRSGNTSLVGLEHNGRVMVWTTDVKRSVLAPPRSRVGDK